MMTDPVTRLNIALEGRYRIDSELGEGGMATVYLADDLRHERKVALKVLKERRTLYIGLRNTLRTWRWPGAPKRGKPPDGGQCRIRGHSAALVRQARYRGLRD